MASRPSTCPQCRAPLDWPAKGQATEIRCPDCNLLIELPASSAASETAVHPAKTKSTSAPKARPVPKPKPVDEDSDAVEEARPGSPPPVSKCSSNRPKPRTKEPGKSGGSSWLMTGGILAVLGGLLMCCVGIGLTLVFAPDKLGKDRLAKKSDTPEDDPPPSNPASGPFVPNPAGGAAPKFRDGRQIVPFSAIATHERLREVKGVQLKGTILFTTANNVNQLEITWEGLKRLKFEENLPDGGYSKILLVGNRGWMTSEKNSITLQGDGLGFYQNFNYATVLSNLIALTDEGFNIQQGEDKTVRGKKCFSLTVSRPFRPTLTMFFEKGTDLLYKADFSGKFVDQNLNFSQRDTFVEFYFSDYQTSDGIKHWRKQEQYRDKLPYSEFTVTQVKFLNKPDSSLFMLPGLDAQVNAAQGDEKRESIKRAADQTGIQIGSDFAKLVEGSLRGNPAQQPLFREALVNYLEMQRANQVPPFGPSDAPALSMLLRDSVDPGQRRMALDAVVAIGPGAAVTAPQLCNLALTSKDRATVLLAITALHRTAVRSAEAINVYEKFLDSADDALRDRCTAAILELGPERVTLQRAMAWTSKPDPRINKAAEEVLKSRLTTATRNDLPLLRDGLKSANRQVRVRCLDAVGSLLTGGREATSEIAPLVASADAEESERAVAALKSVGG
ncbi:MAG TPA: hypothetical protein VFE62_30300, partial [Gemmataceae bacterium]|nr:hypothetical protein [Gemmataceae bacterium]